MTIINSIFENNHYLSAKMSSEIQFTRYLYEKDEVKLSLIMCILNKKESESEFWAYELYHSGFKLELIDLFWSLYYDFYYTMNPSFEKYLQSKLKNHLELDVDSENYISMIVNNFMIRPHNMDIFILKQIVNICDFDKTDIQQYIMTGNFEVMRQELLTALRSKDFMTLASLIVTDIKDKDIMDTFKTILDYFVNTMELKINSEKNVLEYEKYLVNNYQQSNKRVIVLARTLHYFVLLNNSKMGKNIYVHIEPEEVVLYKTINADLKEKDKRTILPARKILPLAKVYTIDGNNYLSLFELKREKQDIKNAYYYKWLYYASFSPLWKSRIIKYNGFINETEKSVLFEDDDIEMFYREYGYEPDEQSLAVENTTIQDIRKERTWLSFYNEHKNNGIVEIEEDILNDMDKIAYKF
jgi:hypothetical protein